MKYQNERGKAHIIAGLALLTAAAIAIHGYHVGVEDQDVYLAAVKKWLNPQLYPVNAEFFMEQMRASAFIPSLSATVRILGVPWALLTWHIASMFLVFLGCWRIAEIGFVERTARWASVILVAVMLTVPIAGTALYPVDQYLHPRAPATAGILLSIAAVLRQQRIKAALWLLFAALMHPLMAVFGLSLLVFISLRQAPAEVFAMVLPFALFGRPSAAWNEAVSARSYYFPLRWEWYEWLGVLAPIALVWWCCRIARARHQVNLERLGSRLLLFAFFQLIVAIVVTVPSSTIQLAALQPMRWLHIFYFFFLIIAGGYVGQFVLRNRVWAWVLIFGSLAGIMFYVQRDLFAHSDHIEWPGSSPRNDWAEAFLWVRANTTPNSVFALPPRYMDLPGEDAYGFRAWAERSMLAEDQKDPGAATVFPSLAGKWQEQVAAERGIERFSTEQFAELRKRFGVGWIILPATENPPLSCPHRNQAAVICRIN